MEGQFICTAYKNGKRDIETFVSIVREDIYHGLRSRYTRFMDHPEAVSLECVLSDKTCTIIKPKWSIGKFTFKYSDNEGNSQEYRLDAKYIEKYFDKYMIEKISGPSWCEYHKKIDQMVVPNTETLLAVINLVVDLGVARLGEESRKDLRAYTFEGDLGVILYLGSKKDSFKIYDRGNGCFVVWVETSYISDKLLDVPGDILFEKLRPYAEDVFKRRAKEENTPKPDKSKAPDSKSMAGPVAAAPYKLMYTPLEKRLLCVCPDAIHVVDQLNEKVQTLHDDPSAGVDYYIPYAHYYIHRSVYDTKLFDVDIMGLGVFRTETVSRLSSLEDVVDAIIMDDMIYSYAPERVDAVAQKHIDPARILTRRDIHSYTVYLNLNIDTTRGEKEGALFGFVSDFMRSDYTRYTGIIESGFVSVIKVTKNDGAFDICHLIFYRGNGAKTEDEFVPADKLFDRICELVMSLDIPDADCGMNRIISAKKGLAEEVDLTGMGLSERFSLVRSKLHELPSSRFGICFISGQTRINVTPSDEEYMIYLDSPDVQDTDMVKMDELLEYILERI